MLGKVTDAVTEITTTQNHHSQILTRHSELLEKILETQHNYGYRLNAIDGRLTLRQSRKLILSQKNATQAATARRSGGLSKNLVG